jgi:hypothetical protein
VEPPAEPAATLTVAGDMASEKSGAALTAKVTVAVCDREPLTPVTVTV